MRITVAILGGGLSGLYAARLLLAAGREVQLFEARARLGGRILSVDGQGAPSDDGFELGPSWLWPGSQAEFAALVRELGLELFPQHSDGDVLLERSSRGPAQRVRGFRQEPESMRLAGGTSALVRALAAELPPTCVQLEHRLTRATLEPDGIRLSFATRGGLVDEVAAEHVVLALPPRLAAATVEFSPALDAATAARWASTPTWMAPHAKFIALYERPFWRAARLSGTAQSAVGPMVELHDATTHSGAAALFGFIGVPATQRAALGEPTLVRACVDQLVRLFGPDAAAPRATLLKDWSRDPLTATAADVEPEGHPVPSPAPWVTGPWSARLSLCGSETSDTEPGLLAGAIQAAARSTRALETCLPAQRG
ncbi:MAG: FAD-dependent oxidoreductase [Kofleriaceae bacterium]